MKQIGILVLLLGTCAAAQAQTWVNGHTRQDGSYMEGHMRSAPNSTRYDNYNAENSVYRLRLGSFGKTASLQI